jgi:hypothetical protein
MTAAPGIQAQLDRKVQLVTLDLVEIQAMLSILEQRALLGLLVR